jgi:hypothetical protein
MKKLKDIFSNIESVHRADLYNITDKRMRAIRDDISERGSREGEMNRIIKEDGCTTDAEVAMSTLKKLAVVVAREFSSFEQWLVIKYGGVTYDNEAELTMIIGHLKGEYDEALRTMPETLKGLANEIIQEKLNKAEAELAEKNKSKTWVIKVDGSCEAEAVLLILTREFGVRSLNAYHYVGKSPDGKLVAWINDDFEPDYYHVITPAEALEILNVKAEEVK